MATLEQAAETLAKKLLEFRDLAEETAEKATALREDIEGYEEEVNEEWSEFTSAVESLLAAVEDHAGKVDPRGDEAGQTVEALGELIGQAQEALAGDLQENEDGLLAVKEQASGLVVEVERLVMEAVETPAESVAEQLQAAAEGAETVVKEGIDSIGAFMEQAELTKSLAEALVDATVKILADNGTWVKQAVVKWTSQLTEIEDRVALEGFKKAEEHAGTVADYALDQCTEAQRASLEEVERLVEQARQELQALQDSIGQQQQGVESAAESVGEAAQDLQEAIGEADAGLDRVAAILTRYRAM